MAHQYNVRLPAGHPITFDVCARQWVADWTNRSAAARAITDATDADVVVTTKHSDRVAIVPMVAPSYLPRFYFSADFMLPSFGLINGVPLVPDEDLAKLRDPPRYSWRQVYWEAEDERSAQLALGGIAPFPYPKARAIHRVLSAATLFAAARVGCHALCCHPAEYHASCTPAALASYRGACTYCDVHRLLLSTCCGEAVVQPLPRLPSGHMARFFHDATFDPSGTDFKNAWAEHDHACSAFVAANCHYPMTCRHTIEGAATDTLRGLVASVLLGPGEMAGIVGEYLGRNLFACLVSPLFGRTCAHHPSLLDRMDADGPWTLAKRDRSGRLRRKPDGQLPSVPRRIRILRCAHFHYVLSPMVLRHAARVQSAARVLASVSQRLAVAQHVLTRPQVPCPGPEHFKPHRQSREMWALLHATFFRPLDFLLETMAQAERENDPDLAPWCRITTPLLFDVMKGYVVCAPNPWAPPILLNVYVESVTITDELAVTRWIPRPVMAHAMVFNRPLHLAALYTPLPDSCDLCGPSCYEDSYRRGVAEWAKTVGCGPLFRRQTSQMKRRRSPRRYGEVDPDSTEEDVIYETEREEEEEEEDEEDD